MDSTSFQNGVLISKSIYLWIVPTVFSTGEFMGYQLDNYEQFFRYFIEDAKSKQNRESNSKQKGNSGSSV